LHGGKQQRDQYADDGDNHQQFDEREARPGTNVRHGITSEEQKERMKNETR
jgi:hypothetical protein